MPFRSGFRISARDAPAAESLTRCFERAVKRPSSTKRRALVGVGPLPRLAPTLASIVAPVEVEYFLKRLWKRKPFYCRGTAARLPRVLQALGAMSIKTLLTRSRRYAVLGKNPDKRSTAHPSIQQAIKAYDQNGATLYFALHDESPLGSWTACIADELGEPPIGVTSVFAVRNRNGTKPHFDWNENFTIQIRGAKRWIVSSNHFIEHPVSNWEMGDAAPLYAHHLRVPRKMPADARSYLLTPGSVLYVPRGYLHQVTSVDEADSLSVNICFPPTPWATLFCTLLSNRLLANPAFRDSLLGVFGRGWGRAEFFDKFPDMESAFSSAARKIRDDVHAIVSKRNKLEEYLIRRRFPIV